MGAEQLQPPKMAPRLHLSISIATEWVYVVVQHLVRSASTGTSSIVSDITPTETPKPNQKAEKGEVVNRTDVVIFRGVVG